MYLTPVLKLMAEKQASDLFISAGMPLAIKILGTIMPVNADVLDPETVKKIAYEMMSEKEQQDFEQNWEMNFSFPVPEVGRFRVNVFRQRGNVALVIRYLRTQTPGIEALRLPSILKDLIMEKRGLILVVGATGSGKSTTLAAMIDHRNNTRGGHILTIEDPIEFVFKHNRSVINQREVGLDTKSYQNALVNAMREAPDILMIGESRDRETLQQALLYAQTGHLCLSTLHANNSYHALGRILSFYTPESRPALLSDLASGLKAIVSQRLLRATAGGRIPAVEVLLNTKLVSELIEQGDFNGVKEAMEKSLAEGSQTFEQDLARLITTDMITRDEGLAYADSPTNLMWRLQNDMSPVSRIQPKKEENDDQPTFTEIQLDVRDESSTMSGMLRPN
jgi:twitching motility protein PilU